MAHVFNSRDRGRWIYKFKASLFYRLQTLHLCTNERIMFKLCRKTLSQKRYVWGDLVASGAGLTYPCSWLGVSETLTLLARLGSQSWSPLPSWSLYPDPRNLHEVTSLAFPGPGRCWSLGEPDEVSDGVSLLHTRES